MGSIIQLIVAVITIASLWTIYETFGQKGWAAIIPFYNLIVLLRIIKWEPYKFWLFFIPIYNIYLAYLAYKDLAAKYGQGTPGYAIGILLLPFVFLALLAFKSQPVENN